MILISLLFYTLIVVVCIQVAYYISFLLSFALKQPVLLPKKNISISIIICAKNEAENLKKNIPLVLEQDYPLFEVVLVNDSSSDDSLEVMKEFAELHSNIKLVDVKTIETFWGNKKYALTLGIKASKNDFLVFTDADCKPISKQWLAHISNNFSNEKSIVLGYGAYNKHPFSFLNKLIRFETVMTALQYFSYANLGLPYMGVGRNMAYRKELFFNNSGFNNHMKLKSGDDDLFINEVASKTNTAICYNEESFTISEPKTSFRSWILQKRRHISTAKFYKPLHQLLLGLFYFTQFLFWVLSIILIVLGYPWIWLAIPVAFRFIIQFICFGLTAKKLNEVDLIILTPLLEFFLILTQLSIFIANLISKPKHWK
ncbi:MAG: glycosyltransferase [Winogradskyella sp.]|nr:glycosyltransferase [Winogradskyella sp.]